MASDRPDVDQQMLDRISDGVVALSRDLVVTHHNQAAARLADREGQRLVGHRLWDVFPQGQGSRLDTMLSRAVADQRVVEFEDFAPVSKRWLWRRLYPAEDGVTFIFGESALPRASEDEIRASLTRALASEARYRNLLDGMREGVIETTPAGLILSVNLAFAAMLGYDSPHDFLTSVPSARDVYVTPEERPDQLSRVIKGSKPVSELQLRRKDGTHVWSRVSTTTRRDPSGEISSLQTIVEDITELHYTGQELRQISERIEERERKLLAESVHDDPLQLIVAALLRIDTLPDLPRSDLGETVEQIAGLLEQSVDRLRQLITALTPPDLTGGLGEALLHAAEGIFVGTTTEVHISGPHHVPLSPAVKADCYRVLREGLVNARRHANAHQVTITLDVDDDAVSISVTDDGEGAGVLNAGPGHLGVPLMKARAEALGGQLQIESARGRGTGVRLLVPRTSLSTSANDPEP